MNNGMNNNMSKEEKEYIKYIRSVMNTDLVDDSLSTLCSSIEKRLGSDSLMVVHEYDHNRNVIDFIVMDIRDNDNGTVIKTSFYTEDIIDFEVFVGDTYGCSLDFVSNTIINELKTMYEMIVIPQQQAPVEEEIDL